jgi:MYXO-CTERM domain-containing protein
MRFCPLALSRRRLRLALASTATISSVAFAVDSFAGIPVGWYSDEIVDGGTISIGASIAASDTIAAVGAPFAPGGAGGSPSGAVYLFSSAGGAWSFQPIAPSSPIANGNFGTAVAASGGLVAVGAAGTPPAAYVFTGDAGSFAQLQAWTDPASDQNGSFGGGVAVFASTDGTSYVAISAPPGGANPNGIVYVSRSVAGGAWSTPLVEITDPTAEAFGISVAFAGNGQLLVGDPGTGAGQVVVYAPEADGGWEREGTLAFSLDGGTVQQFGNSIATWNNLAVVTGPSTADTAATYNGAAFVFASDDAGTWTQQAVLTGAAAESFGNFNAAVQGGLIAVGSAVNDSSGGAGQVDVWALDGGAWVSVPSTALVGDSYYGQAVALVGSTVFVGDTSALGASSISSVTSSLYVDTAVYADAGSAADATAGAGVDASFADGGGGNVDASADDAPTSSSGCSCKSTAQSGSGGAMALLAEGALVFVVWHRRRRGRREKQK